MILLKLTTTAIYKITFCTQASTWCLEKCRRSAPAATSSKGSKPTAATAETRRPKWLFPTALVRTSQIKKAKEILSYLKHFLKGFSIQKPQKIMISPHLLIKIVSYTYTVYCIPVLLLLLFQPIWKNIEINMDLFNFRYLFRSKLCFIISKNLFEFK